MTLLHLLQVVPKEEYKKDNFSVVLVDGDNNVVEKVRQKKNGDIRVLLRNFYGVMSVSSSWGPPPPAGGGISPEECPTLHYIT